MAPGASSPSSGRRSPSDSSEPAPERDYFSIALDWRRWWTILPEIVALICAGLLPIIVMANVVARYTDWYHVFWAEDVVKVLFLWVVFLGGAVAVKYDAHVRMAMISDRLARTGRAGAWWQTAIRASPLLIGVVLLVLGVRIVEISMLRELPTLRISAGYFSTVVPVSGALMILYVLRALVGGADRNGRPKTRQGN